MRPTLLVCGFGPFPAAPENPASLVVQRLRDAHWSPNGADAAYAILPTEWRSADEVALVAMRNGGCAAVLLVGVAVRARKFRVETRALNRTAADRPDAAGQSLGRSLIEPDGAAALRVTAPVRPVLSALHLAGLPARTSNDAGAYLCNYTLHRVLAAQRAEAAERTAGFLHVPQARELVGAAAPFSLDDIKHAVCTAAQAYSDALSTPPPPSA